MAKADLTAERLRELLHYDPATGVFTWRVRRGPKDAGGVAGCIGSGNGRKRLLIRIDDHLHKAHRLAWLYVHGEWPDGLIDHINGDPLDNRITNLRVGSVVTNQQNMRGPQKNNRCGFLGVFRSRGSSRWTAQIRSGGKNTHLGMFDTPEAAHEAYLAAKRKLHPGCTI